jgi:hypothetical protein
LSIQHRVLFRDDSLTGSHISSFNS